MTTPEHTDPFAERVIARLKEEHVTPRPRWNFTALNASFWALGAGAIILGAFAFAAALFEVANADWEYYPVTHSDFFSFFVSVAPLLWIVAIALFSFLGYENIRATKRGYRYPLVYLVLGAVLTSLVLGTGFYLIGAGEAIEEGIGDHPPFYRPLMLEERGWWQQPAQGLLAGTVTSVAEGKQTFTLTDFSGHVWTVDMLDLRGPDLAALATGGAVRVVGVPTTASSTFHACFVLSGKIFNAANPTHAVFIFASSSERMLAAERTDICKGIRPYGSLRALTGQ